MTRLQFAVGGIASAAMLLATTDPAMAHVRHYHHYRTGYHHTYARDCWSEHHDSANTGTVLGAGGGAVVGHQIGAHAHRCR